MTEQQVVIIGGSEGIGLAVAKAARTPGARVLAVSRTREKLEAARDVVSGLEIRVADINNTASIQELFSELATVDHVYIAAGLTLCYDRSPILEGILKPAALGPKPGSSIMPWPPKRDRNWIGMAHRNGSRLVCPIGGISPQKSACNLSLDSASWRFPVCWRVCEDSSSPSSRKDESAPIADIALSPGW